MKHQYLINTPLDTAVLEYIKEIQNTGTTHGTETISVCESCGRVTANAVYAKICSPHYTACAMDGIALKSSLTFGAAQTSPVQLSSCDYTEVDTGDPLPYGADCVVMVEDLVESSGKILLHDSAVPWQNVRQIGEDICAGDMILPSYSEITPAAVGAMLAGGVLNILAVKRPVVGIIPTGDEIIPPCDNPKDGDIIEFNSSIFKGILETWGASALVYPIVKDDRDLIVSALKSAVSECDAVILNAGSSAGREDFSAYAIENIGKIIYHGIAIKPGKPAVLGICGNVPVLGVPGYPVSGIIVLEHILK
ncbi:MAG: molybdopterin biosynthesis protein, partial [Oscillospiraceae bacterium]|nr:molybdopterin biosynthesis protein [Oscillospiraceae bacterium]